jgi:NADH-quinone oxidoreductase subunit M
MVNHGLITGALFLLAGSFWQRTEDYELGHYGGLASQAPRLTGATTLAAFASLGLPGLAGFVAEFQIFVGTFAVYPVLAGIALLGVLITAALFLQMLQQLFFGETPERLTGFADLGTREAVTLATLLAFVVVIGVWPTWLLDLITPAGRALIGVTGG